MALYSSDHFVSRHPLAWGVLIGLSLGANIASAATPRASFGAALVTGADNRISVSRVPVLDSVGKVYYKDLTINFQVDSTGNLTLGTATIYASPSLVTSGFQAGNYKDTLGNTYQLTGPSVIPGTTRTVWSLAFTAGTYVTQFSMSWVTGAIAGHPNESSLKSRNITSTAYSWGIVGNSTGQKSGFPFYNWGNYAYVVGAAQAGNQLVLHLFKDINNIEDSSVSLTKY
jgi:hypothetical protein